MVNAIVGGRELQASVRSDGCDAKQFPFPFPSISKRTSQELGTKSLRLGVPWAGLWREGVGRLFQGSLGSSKQMEWGPSGPCDEKRIVGCSDDSAKISVRLNGELTPVARRTSSSANSGTTRIFSRPLTADYYFFVQHVENPAATSAWLLSRSRSSFRATRASGSSVGRRPSAPSMVNAPPVPTRL